MKLPALHLEYERTGRGFSIIRLNIEVASMYRCMMNKRPTDFGERQYDLHLVSSSKIGLEPEASFSVGKCCLVDISRPRYSKQRHS